MLCGWVSFGLGNWTYSAYPPHLLTLNKLTKKERRHTHCSFCSFTLAKSLDSMVVVCVLYLLRLHSPVQHFCNEGWNGDEQSDWSVLRCTVATVGCARLAVVDFNVGRRAGVCAGIPWSVNILPEARSWYDCFSVHWRKSKDIWVKYCFGLNILSQKCQLPGNESSISYKIHAFQITRLILLKLQCTSVIKFNYFYS